MSFMNAGGGADCSVNSNPLAQFSKQSNVDRSLQHSIINQQEQQQNGRGSQQQQQQGIHQVPQMDQQDRDRFHRFARGESNSPGLQHHHHPAAGLGNFQPMHHELNQIHQHNNNNIAWTDDFRSSTTANPITHQPQVLSSEGGNMMNSKWATDFQTNSRSSSISQQHSGNMNQGQQHHGMMRHSSPMMMNMMHMRSGGGLAQQRPMMQHQGSSSNSKVVELDSSKWEDQFNEIEKDLQAKQNQDEEIIVDDKYKANFDEVWDALNHDLRNDEAFNDEYEASWQKDFDTYSSTRLNYGQYQYSEQNQFLENPNAYEVGLKLMANGARLSEAALAFEAAVKQNEDHVDAWLKLGQVQVRNEKEFSGICALEKCIELDPKNLTALMTLAISYVNEGYDNLAYATLERWIETKYPQVSEKARAENPTINDEDRYSLNKRITELFIKAAQLSPTLANMDADVQTGLGVLFYSMEEFDKTIDCFRAAIQQNPNDSLMWNRLGASLANSNKSEEAIEAYSKALQLNPNFVRARYNLGVSCINMGLYKEAVEHLLAGLSMHHIEGVPQDTSTSNGSTSLIETLKRAFLAMDRRDLLDKVKPGMDLNQFRKEFAF